MTMKREQVERDAAKQLCQYLQVRYGDLVELEVGLAIVEFLRDTSTICGPDEVPMPRKTHPFKAMYVDWDYEAKVDAYQRERNGE